jgi:photosystem II stability/assembly factor-like uncharacterized protein
MLILLTLSGVFVAYHYQQPLPVCGDQFAAKPVRFSRAWWTCPTELNRHARVNGNIGNQDLVDVKFSTDNLRGWVLTKRGEVSGTLDGGISWRKLGGIRDLGVSPDVIFTELIASDDSSKLWVIAKPEPSSSEPRAAMIFNSTDSGGTWAMQEERITPLPVTSSTELLFLDPNKKTWLADQHSTTLLTANGGSHWLVVDESGEEKEEFLFGITFDSSKKNGWALGDNFILKTTDGGQHWKRIENLPNKIKASEFVSKEYDEKLNAFRTFHVDQTGRHIWIAGLATSIFHSADAGETWSQKNLPSLPNITHISFSQDNLHGWAISNLLFPNSIVLETSDGGKSWQEKHLPLLNKHNGIFIAEDQRHLWLAGNHGSLLHSRDGGINWQPQASHPMSNIFDIDVNEQTGHAWLVGNKGIWHSKDKGETWDVVLRDDAADFFPPSLVRFDKTGQRGIVLGTWYQQDDYLARTIDGGQTWIPIKPDPKQKNDFRADGFVVSKDGEKILVYNANREFLSMDFGETWLELFKDIGKEKQLALQKQSSTCSRTYNIEIFARNSGVTRKQREWDTDPLCRLPNKTKSEIGFENDLSDVKLQNLEVLNEKNGAWEIYSENMSYPATWFAFTEDGKYGVATSNRKGKIVISENHAKNWRENTMPTTSRLNTVRYSSDEKQVWAVGEHNAMFMSEDNGETWQAKGLYQRLPPPWFYALCLGLGLMCLTLVIYKFFKHIRIKHKMLR